MLVGKRTSFINAEVHDITDVLRLCNDLCLNKGFINMIYPCRIGHFGRIIDPHRFAFYRSGNKTYVGYSCYHRLIKLPFQTLLYDLHMQHTQESATETKA